MRFPGVKVTCRLLAWSAGLLLGGCETVDMTPPPPDNPPMPPGGPNWRKVDETVQRTRDREKAKGQLVQTSRTERRAGFEKMTEAQYNDALDSARTEVRKANPGMSDTDVEARAVRIADEAKRKFESSFPTSTSTTVEVKKP